MGCVSVQISAVLLCLNYLALLFALCQCCDVAQLARDLRSFSEASATLPAVFMTKNHFKWLQKFVIAVSEVRKTLAC